MKRIAGSILITLFIATGASAQFKRIAASEFAKDPAKVAALKRAITRMKERNTRPRTSADFRQSWVYWANTHGYFGTGPNASGSAQAFKAQANSNCAGLTGIDFSTCVSYYAHVTDFSLPSDGGITAKIWGTCQHGNLQFLPWHRIYLKYYERTLRKFSGVSSFALPYWDYYGTLGPSNGIALPTMMRGTASSNTLVDTFRTRGLNNNSTSIDPSTGDASQAFDFNTFSPFSNVLEQQPHGVMHCGTGTGCQAPDMGIVPVAGLDPVFYMHHANIDRLWQCWMVRKANGATINLAWAKANLGMPQSWFDQVWNFVDENGQPVSMKVSALFEPGGIDYVYDQVTNCVPANETPVNESPQPASARPDVTNAFPIALEGQRTSVPLTPSTSEGPGDRDVPAEVEAESGRTILMLENVRVEGGNPGITYRIHLNRRGDTRREYVATINWFGILHRGHEHEGPETARGHRLLFFDVTDELARLGNPPHSEVDVTFEPSRGNEESPQPSASGGTVTVGRIRLQTKD